MHIEKKYLGIGRVSRLLLVMNSLMALIYIAWWFDIRHAGNAILYYLLFFGELYHVVMALSFWFTIWPGRTKLTADKLFDDEFCPSIDIFITVAGEPIDIVRKTAIAARDMEYPHKSVYILNDGRVAGSDNWQDIEKMAKTLGVTCITRTTPGGAKAGNINNALKQTSGEFVAVFDADMVPYSHFAKTLIPHFKNKKVGFVQTPQYYKNNGVNQITEGAWDQQRLFFGPIMHGKDRSNSAFICGTNFIIRRSAIMEVGGMVEDNIAEDFLTSLHVHQKGWVSHYVPEIMAEGLAPEDLLSYFKQQLRWARGSLEVLFGANPLFKRHLRMAQKIQYLSSALYYFNGVILLIDMIMPLFYLFFGLEPVSTSTTAFAVFFIPYMFLSLFTLYLTSAQSITFKALAYSQSSWTLQLMALKSVLLKQKMSFAVTPKKAQEGNFLFLAYPHIVYILLVCIATGVGIAREGLNPSVVTNLAWASFNVLLFIPFIAASYNWNTLFKFNKDYSGIQS